MNMNFCKIFISSSLWNALPQRAFKQGGYSRYDINAKQIFSNFGKSGRKLHVYAFFIFINFNNPFFNQGNQKRFIHT